MANTILGKLLIQISGNTVELNKALSTTQAQISGFQKSISATNKLLAGFGVGLGVSAVMGAFKDGVGIIKDFEKQMDTVLAITGATDAEFEKLRKSALELGRTTKFTSQQVAELQTEYGRLGFSTQEILDATEATINLSIATGSDLAKAADVAGSTIRGFGLNANETGRVVDVMAESFNKTALGIENFSEAMKYVAPIAAQAGLSVEETTALLGTLADAGIRGSMAGTSLRKIISDLGTESGDLSERIAKLAAKGLTGAEAMSEVGRTAYASLLVLAKNKDKTDELTVALNNAAGAGQRAADIMGDNLAGDLDELDSAYEGLILTMSEGSSVLRDFVQAGTAILQALSDQEKGVGSLVSKWLSLVGTIPRALGSMASFINVVADGDQPLEAVNRQLERLNALRDDAEKRGDIDTVIELNRVIGEVQARYNILGLTIKAVGEESDKAATKIPGALTPALGLIESLESRIKAFEEAKKKAFNSDDVAVLNDKIKELKEQLDLLNSSTANLSGFGKNVLNAEAGTVKVDPLKIDKPEGLNFKLPPVEPPDMTATIAAFDEVQKKYKETGIIAYNENQQMALGWDLQIERQMAAADAAAEYGNVIGDALGQALSGQMSFADAAKKLTADLLKTFLARALGGIIASAATSGGPPPVAIALAAAGVAAISAMFAKIGGPTASAGGASLSSQSASNVSRLPSTSNGNQVDFEKVTFEIEGTKLIGVMNNQEYKSRRTG